MPQAGGYGYFYADKNNPTLTLSTKLLDVDVNSTAVGHTLSFIYGSSESTGYLMYDDQDPSGAQHESNGHTKGDLVFGSEGGYWLVHSVPRWPPAPPAKYDFPLEEKTYGQSMLCLSLDISTINKVAGNFLINKPFVYAHKLSTSLESKVANVKSVLAGQWVMAATATSIDFTTTGGSAFTAFAKNEKWNQTLSENLVDPHYSSGFTWETWQNGAAADKIPSFCTPKYKYADMNAATVSSAGLTWDETHDHSKWGIATGGPKVVCIGDINRQWSQNLRAGGTVCQTNSDIYNTFSSFLSATAPCS